MTRRIRLTIAYDGTDYVGWQVQPNGVAIETVMAGAIKKVTGEDVLLIGASRTDSGVHADGNVAVFDTESRIPAEKFKFALNEFLPRDISVQASVEVSPDYHPRKLNAVKTYEYRILNRVLPLPKERNYAYFYYYPLDAEKMDRAAKVLLGEHDFKSFCSIRTSVEDTVRRIYTSEVRREGDIITYRVSGSGFLYNMVRIIAGTLVKIGSGLWPEEKMGEILEARDRAEAGPRAPAMGLTLVAIEEEQALPPVETEDNPHWAYEIDYREKPNARVHIFRSDEKDFDALLLRLIKRASRNGALYVYVTDDGGRIRDGGTADYFTLECVPDAPGTFVTVDKRKLVSGEE